MTELLDQLGQLAKERADSLHRTSKALAGEAEGFLFFAKYSCDSVRFLAAIWDAVDLRIRRGGVPAKGLIQECDLLLHVGAALRQHLQLIIDVWLERKIPGDAAHPIYHEVRETTRILDSLVQLIRETRARAAASPRISADPEVLKKRIQQADEGGEWLKLTDVVAEIRHGDWPK
jgi:hypothetical protein